MVKVVHTMLWDVVYVCVSVDEQDKFTMSCKAALCLVLERKLLHIDGFTMLNS